MKQNNFGTIAMVFFAVIVSAGSCAPTGTGQSGGALLNPTVGGTAGPAAPSMIPTGVVAGPAHEATGGSDTTGSGQEVGSDSGKTVDSAGIDPTTPPPAAGVAGGTSDAPITVIGTTMGGIPIPPLNCPSPDVKYFFDGFQMGWTGHYDSQGRWEILTKQRLLQQVGSGPVKGYGGDEVQIIDAAFPTPAAGTSVTEQEGCLFAVIYFPPNRVNRDIIFSYKVSANPSLECPLPTPAQSTDTIPEQPPATAISRCDGSAYQSPYQPTDSFGVGKISPNKMDMAK